MYRSWLRISDATICRPPLVADATVVWSPFSNLWLYHQTTDVVHASEFARELVEDRVSVRSGFDEHLRERRGQEAGEISAQPVRSGGNVLQAETALGIRDRDERALGEVLPEDGDRGAGRDAVGEAAAEVDAPRPAGEVASDLQALELAGDCLEVSSGAHA